MLYSIIKHNLTGDDTVIGTVRACHPAQALRRAGHTPDKDDPSLSGADRLLEAYPAYHFGQTGYVHPVLIRKVGEDLWSTCRPEIDAYLMRREGDKND